MITFADLLSPFRRQLALLIGSFIIFFALTLGLLYYGLPTTNKTTLYFSVKPVATEQSINSFDPIESTMKAAEGIAGWAKNPSFRQTIMDRSGIQIHNFKRKISARKQDRINVFWTLNLEPGQEGIIDATRTTIEETFATWNDANASPYAMTPIQTYTEGRTIPLSWLIAFSLVLAAGLATLLVLFQDILKGRLSFEHQIRQIFGNSPLLKVSEKLGSHDEKLLERFILTFTSPRLIGTFPEAEKHFSLAPTDAIDETIDTPILIVQMGKTTVRELQNMKAIFGEECGLIVFEN